MDQAEIGGDLATMVQQLHARVSTNNGAKTTAGEGFRDQVQLDYPEWALRELLHNALIHRDYASTTPTRFTWFSDRIEIQSPGDTFGAVTRDNLTRRNAYRNPTIAEAMKELGYVNRFGFGIQRAERLLANNGNPPLEFDVDDYGFTVTIRRSGS